MNSHIITTAAPKYPRQQQGIATVLIVILVGLALTATALTMTGSIRHSQEKHVAANAVTHAQTGVWVGAEALRQYLLTLNEQTILGLNGTALLDMAFTGDSLGTLTARNIQATQSTAGGPIQVTADIYNIHDNAQSSATLGVVYQVTLTPPSPPITVTQAPAAVSFYDDVSSAGAIAFDTPASVPSVVNIEGDFTTAAGGLQPISVLRVTGDVDIGFGVKVERIRSNGDVHLRAGASADMITTIARIFMHPSSAATTLKANGDITVDTYGISGITSMESLANIDINVGTHGTAVAGGELTLNAWMQGDIAAVGDITLESVLVRAGNITSESDLHCPPGFQWYRAFVGDIRLKGNLASGCVLPGGSYTAADPTTQVTLMPEVQPEVVPPFTVDVWRLKSAANYVFEYKDGHPKVTVNNINGIPDGEYHIGRYGTHHARICNTLNDGTDECATPSTETYPPVCIGSSVATASSCISYDTSTDTWTVSASSMAPGTVWFKGNLSINMWYTYTSFFASGHIDVSTWGNFLGRAVNYGGKSEMCEMNGHLVASMWLGYYYGHTYPSYYYRDTYNDFYPTDMCSDNTASAIFTPSPLGNIAMAAGGIDPDGPGVHTGGDITLGNTSWPIGSVLAGGHLTTGGSTIITGHVVATNQSTNSTTTNDLNNSLNVKLLETDESDAFRPDFIPDMRDPTDIGASADDTPAEPAESTILWTRPL